MCFVPVRFNFPHYRSCSWATDIDLSAQGPFLLAPAQVFCLTLLPSHHTCSCVMTVCSYITTITSAYVWSPLATVCSRGPSCVFVEHGVFPQLRICHKLLSWLLYMSAATRRKYTLEREAWCLSCSWLYPRAQCLAWGKKKKVLNKYLLLSIQNIIFKNFLGPLGYMIRALLSFWISANACPLPVSRLVFPRNLSLS